MKGAGTVDLLVINVITLSQVEISLAPNPRPRCDLAIATRPYE